MQPHLRRCALRRWLVTLLLLAHFCCIRTWWLWRSWSSGWIGGWVRWRRSRRWAARALRWSREFRLVVGVDPGVGSVGAGCVVPAVGLAVGSACAVVGGLGGGAAASSASSSALNGSFVARPRTLTGP